MVNVIGFPTVQNLGMQGDKLHIKVSFPITQNGEVVAHHAAIFKMRAEDLPETSGACEVLHFDLGQYITSRYS